MMVLDCDWILATLTEWGGTPLHLEAMGDFSVARDILIKNNETQYTVLFFIIYIILYYPYKLLVKVIILLKYRWLI